MDAILILTITLFFSMAFGLLVSKGGVSICSIQNGFMLLVITSCMLSFLLVSEISAAHSLGIIALIATLIILVKFREIKINFEQNYFYLCLFLIFIVLLALNELLQLRFHSSPDNHGFAATIGTFITDYSYHNLRYQFMNYTGLNEALFLGQKTPLLESTWNIADTRLRYTSDMIFTVGRIGLPLWGAAMLSVFDPIMGFGAFMIALSILASFFLIYNVKNTTLLVMDYATSEQKRSKFTSFFCINASTILLFSPFITIFILEGTLTQLFLLSAATYLVYLMTKLVLTEEEQPALISQLLIVNLFISFVYPNGVILISFLTSSAVFYLLFKKDSSKKIFTLIALVVIDVVICHALLGDALIHLTKSFLSGISGAPYYLGLITIFDFMSWSTGTIEFSQNTGPNTGFVNHAGLYRRFPYLVSLINSLPLWVYLAFAIHFYRRNIKIFLYLVPVFVVFTLSAISQPLDMTKFHPYIHARNLGNLIIICSPLLYSVIFLFLEKRSKTINQTLSALFLLISMSSVYSFFNATENFISVTSPLNIINNVSEYDALDLNNAIIVSDKPDHNISSLALAGRVLYLTDNWGPRFYAKDYPSPINIVYAEEMNNVYTFEKIGVFSIVDQVNGPVTKSEIIQLPTFQDVEPKP